MVLGYDKRGSQLPSGRWTGRLFKAQRAVNSSTDGRRLVQLCEVSLRRDCGLCERVASLEAKASVAALGYDKRGTKLLSGLWLDRFWTMQQDIDSSTCW